MADLAETLDQRSPERLRFHYEVERELSDRLRAASAEERATLYGAVYDELFARVPDHPQLVVKASGARRAADAACEVALLRRFLRPDSHVLEIGAGDCAVSRGLSRHVRAVTAVDVSFTIARGELPPNVELRITDGRHFPAGDGTVDLVYSNQVLEHLHPEDADLHAREARRVLRPGGAYVCLTPNRLNGPHDISSYFDDEATGFHLREYTTRELSALFLAAGFSKVEVLLKVRGRSFVVAATPLTLVERGLELLPPARRRQAAGSPFVCKVLGRVVATA